MNLTPRREKFRAILDGGECVHPASVFDPLSARIAEDLGFALGMFAGSTASLTVLGAPDVVVLTLSEFAGQALRISRASALPFMVDADHGYGNALNVRRTVEELEMAGVAGLTIEDTLLPAPFGAHEKMQLISIKEGVGKLKAALSARHDRALVIIGRTSAMGVTGTADAVARIEAYAAVGVDAIFLANVTKRDQVEAASKAVKLPLILGNVAPELADREWLKSQRVRVCLQGHQPIMAAVQAIHDTMLALKNGTPPNRIERTASADYMKHITRDAQHKSWTREFLGG